MTVPDHEDRLQICEHSRGATATVCITWSQSQFLKMLYADVANDE
jgi:hypothetical protein